MIRYFVSQRPDPDKPEQIATFVGLHENWTLELRFQVSGVRCQEGESLNPET